MSVLQCDRDGCNEIMCNKTICHHKYYICYNCEEELRVYRETWEDDRLTIEDVEFKIKQFMHTMRKGRNSKNDIIQEEFERLMEK